MDGARHKVRLHPETVDGTEYGPPVLMPPEVLAKRARGDGRELRPQMRARRMADTSELMDSIQRSHRGLSTGGPRTCANMARGE